MAEAERPKEDRVESLFVPALYTIKQPDEQLTDKIRQAAKKLEGVPEDEIDFHPNSDNKVIDLIHPSLFCYVYGVTKETEEEHLLPHLDWDKFY